MSDGGKGDKPRPTNYEEYSKRYERIFGKKNTKKDNGNNGGRMPSDKARHGEDSEPGNNKT